MAPLVPILLAVVLTQIRRPEGLLVRIRCAGSTGRSIFTRWWEVVLMGQRCFGGGLGGSFCATFLLLPVHGLRRVVGIAGW